MKLDEARRSYEPIAHHASLLFFAISSLGNIDVMYQYSLSWYIQLFTKSIECSEKSEYLEQRIDSLRDFFTASLYQNVCRSLFEDHKLLFSFMLTCKILESAGRIPGSLYQFLIS